MLSNLHSSWRRKGKSFSAHLSADGCFHAFRMTPTCILSKLTLISLSLSTASVSDDFFFSWVASLTPAAFFLKFKIKCHYARILQMEKKYTGCQYIMVSFKRLPQYHFSLDSGLHLTYLHFWHFAMSFLHLNLRPPSLDFWLLPTKINREYMKLKLCQYLTNSIQRNPRGLALVVRALVLVVRSLLVQGLNLGYKQFLWAIGIGEFPLKLPKVHLWKTHCLAPMQP